MMLLLFSVKNKTEIRQRYTYLCELSGSHILKRELGSYFDFTLNKRTAFFMIMIIMTVVLFDSTIVEIASYGGIEAPVSINVMMFIIIFLAFTAINPVLLKSVKKILKSYPHRLISKGLRYSNIIIVVTLILTISLILLIVMQILLVNQYSVSLLRIQTYISHISATIILAFLIFMFGRWLGSTKNYTVALYTVSFLLIGMNLIVSMMFLDAYLSISLKSDVSSYPIVSYVVNFSPTHTAELLSQLFDVLSLTSFLFLWLATATLLKQYRRKLGQIKYFLLIGLPLIYYVYPFQSLFWRSIFPIVTVTSSIV